MNVTVSANDICLPVKAGERLVTALTPGNRYSILCLVGFELFDNPRPTMLLVVRCRALERQGNGQQQLASEPTPDEVT